ncbi:unnamed protein product, partial [Staurois parvus]
LFTKFYNKIKKKLLFFKIFSFCFFQQKIKNPKVIKYHQNEALSQKK